MSTDIAPWSRRVGPWPGASGGRQASGAAHGRAAGFGPFTGCDRQKKRELATADAALREARALADYQKAQVSVESATGQLLDSPRADASGLAPQSPERSGRTHRRNSGC